MPSRPPAAASPHASPAREPARHVASAHADALGDEVTAMDAARAAFAAGDARDALRRLDAYDAGFPRGLLREESAALRAETLLATGDRRGAARIASAFLAAHPSSPHAARLRAIARADDAP